MIAGSTATAQTFLNSFGGSGSAVGKFSFPTGLAYDNLNGLLYVADSGNGRVQDIDTAGNTATIGVGILSGPQSVSLDASGNVYIADQDNNRIVELASATQDGTFLKAFGTPGTGFGQMNFPVGVTVDTGGGGVYVGNTQNNRIDIFSSAGVYQESAGSAGSGAGQLSLPHGVAVIPNGDVYTADYGNNRISEFTSFGSFVRTFGAGTLSSPTAVTLNSSHSLLYVTDQNNNRVAVFTAGGSLVTTFGATGSGAGQFVEPDGVTVSQTGMVYVADTANNRIERWFDPASWSTGTNTFTNAATGPTSVGAGPGQLLGNSFTLDGGKSLIVGGTTSVSGSGMLTLAGGALTTNALNATGGKFDYTSGTLSTQSISVSNGGAFSATHGGTVSAPGGTAINDSGSKLTLDGGSQFTTSSLNLQNGTVTVGNATITATAVPGSMAPLNVSGGVLQLTNPTTSIIAGAQLSNSGSILGSGMIEAPFVNTSLGQVSINPGQIQTYTKDASSDGDFSLNAGGSLAFDTKLNLTSNSLLLFALHGVTAGSQYGQIDVTGNFAAGGTLDVFFFNYTPQSGDAFHLLNFGSESGVFSSIELPTLPEGLRWNTSLLYSQGTISVSQAPEPSAVILAVLGGVVLLAGRFVGGVRGIGQKLRRFD